MAELPEPEDGPVKGPGGEGAQGDGNDAERTAGGAAKTSGGAAKTSGGGEPALKDGQLGLF